MPRWEDTDGAWSSASRWTVLFTCCVCGSDVLQVVRSNPDEYVRCVRCEERHVRQVSDRLLSLALNDVPY
ncbi:MAG: hypothetical protein JO020_30230 [Chloroflexi bacterium]|nr:hypothetical protein [Chloroflexota bacterium]MBV9132736.1 hypothetical protein [Chloroflexota bacterium]MBV9898453.1 hypothetical protein [Chloroflexota bacterium]